MTATCWNPILYAWMNDSFREGFVKAIPFLRFKVKPRGRVRVQTEEKPGDCKSTAITTHIPNDCSKRKEETSNYQSDCLQSLRTFPGKNSEEKKSFMQAPESDKIEIILTDDGEMQDNYLL
ncbi:unnamed protein product [Strongylus vulgaris]|uniref:Uncharacterized protein n=1 Tax=Strongylus vulgaris TaxID=40348 RepID=A0A3P7JPH8_STRVU|nr:unnamed protein product [Strongylus vulgaris]